MTQSAHRVLSLAGGHLLTYRKVLRRGGIIISINNDNQVVIAPQFQAMLTAAQLHKIAGYNPERGLSIGSFAGRAKMWQACWRQ